MCMLLSISDIQGIILHHWGTFLSYFSKFPLLWQALFTVQRLNNFKIKHIYPCINNNYIGLNGSHQKSVHPARHTQKKIVRLHWLISFHLRLSRPWSLQHQVVYDIRILDIWQKCDIFGEITSLQRIRVETTHDNFILISWLGWAIQTRKIIQKLNVAGKVALTRSHFESLVIPQHGGG